jgi:mannonate dehydratase
MRGLWANLDYFLNRVLPVAEKAGVKLAMYPDDPPLSPIRGVARIMRSVESFRRLVETKSSAMNGLTLCQGNFTLMTNDLQFVIRNFSDKIFFVHFRDVRGTPSHFEETWHDAGQTDMLSCRRAYRDIGFEVCSGRTTCRPSKATATRTLAIPRLVGSTLLATSAASARPSTRKLERP